MKPEHPIPSAEHDNVLHTFWVMLSELESKADVSDPAKRDPYLRAVVSGGYNILNRIGFTQHRPKWEAREAMAKVAAETTKA